MDTQGGLVSSYLSMDGGGQLARSTELLVPRPGANMTLSRCVYVAFLKLRVQECNSLKRNNDE